MTNTDEEYYLAVAKELGSGLRDDALWTKAFALEDGDESRAKAHYIRLRVAKLAARNEQSSSENQKQLADQKLTTSSSPKISRQPKVKTEPRRKYGFVLSLLAAAVFVWTVKTGFFKKTEATVLPQSPIVEKKQPQPETEDVPTDADLFLEGISVSRTDQNQVFITLDGEITPRKSKLFQSVLDNPSKVSDSDLLIVQVNSNGGDLYAAMSIGMALKKRDKSRHDRAVVVNETSVCYSSCVFILAAGLQRIVYGKVGIHRPFASNPKNSLDDSQQWLEKVAADAKSYLREMRVSESLYTDMLNVPPDQIHIFSSQTELNRYGLLARDPAFDEMVAAGQMERYGIKDRMVFMQRNKRAETECKKNLPNYDLYNNCFQNILSGG